MFPTNRQQVLASTCTRIRTNRHTQTYNKRPTL